MARYVRAAGKNVQAKCSTIQHRPLFILGNQKSGTSAVCSLLARATGLSLSLDIRKDIPVPLYPKVKSGEITMDQYVERNRLDFSRRIIKEPNFTLMHPELRARFPQAKFAIVIRDPRSNIRSILNRLNLPGDLAQLPPETLAAMTPAWRAIMDNSWLGLGGANYIEMMASRWNYMADVYLDQPNDIVLLRYEDFMKDKVAAVRDLANRLGLDALRDITRYVDVDFQPRGNRNADRNAFFGANLQRIERLCVDRMTKLGYECETAASAASAA
ncbi:MAG: sulfotransferase [Tepidisphaeraceae bacterium]